MLPVVDAVMHRRGPHISSMRSAIVGLQRLTGARPGEILSLRIGEIDRGEAVWVYTPQSHKTAHRGHSRTIFFGPRRKSSNHL